MASITSKERLSIKQLAKTGGRHRNPLHIGSLNHQLTDSTSARNEKIGLATERINNLGGAHNLYNTITASSPPEDVDTHSGDFQTVTSGGGGGVTGGSKRGRYARIQSAVNRRKQAGTGKLDMGTLSPPSSIRHAHQ